MCNLILLLSTCCQRQRNYTYLKSIYNFPKTSRNSSIDCWRVKAVNLCYCISYSALFCTGLPSRLMKVSWFCKIWDYRFLWVHHISLLWLQYKTTVSFESTTFHIFRRTLLTYQVIHLSLAAAMWICHNQCINLWDSHCLHGEGKREREREVCIIYVFYTMPMLEALWLMMHVFATFSTILRVQVN